MSGGGCGWGGARKVKLVRLTQVINTENNKINSKNVR